MTRLQDAKKQTLPTGLDCADTSKTNIANGVKLLLFSGKAIKTKQKLRTRTQGTDNEYSCVIV